MGYYMNMVSSDVKIKHENFDKTLAAIRTLAGKETIKDSGGPHFSWVGHDWDRLPTLSETLLEWRWEPIFDNEDIVSLRFRGEKYGDCKHLFDVIAPFVEKGSVIEMRGEDGEQWRWVFDGVSCKERHATVSYDYEEEEE